MKKRKILVSIVLMALLSGCSTLKSRFFKPATEVTTNKPMVYNFIQPRRAILASETVARMKLSSDPVGISNRFEYYSANGNKCRTLSLTTPRAACFIDGRWQEAAPILVSNLP